MKLPLGKAEIEAILPHRDPFLLLDEVTELEPNKRVVARKLVTDEDCAGHFPGNPIMPGVKMVEALAQAGAVAVLSEEENRGKLALFAGIDDVRFKRVVRPGDELLLECDLETVRGPIGKGKARATVNGELAVRGTLTFAVDQVVVIGSTNGRRVGITGLGVNVPDRVFTNKDLEQYVDTTDEWIVERTGIHERRFAAKEEALTDIAAPAVVAALSDAGVDAASIDLIVVATVTPDMMFPTSSALLADSLGMPDAAAFDLLAGCTGFMYAVAQAYAMVSAGLSKRALVVGGDVLSKILDWEDRSTLVLFGDGAGAVVVEHVDEGGFLGFELGADGGGGENLWLPGSGSRYFEDGDKLVKMNGREVFKFATRVLVSSAQNVLDECGLTVDDVDVYVPHQANKRIIDHAAGKLGIPEEKVVVNVDRYGNTSSGSIPLALADAAADGRLREGELVLMTGMGAGLTWGSALIEWNQGGVAA